MSRYASGYNFIEQSHGEERARIYELMCGLIKQMEYESDLIRNNLTVIRQSPAMLDVLQARLNGLQ